MAIIVESAVGQSLSVVSIHFEWTKENVHYYLFMWQEENSVPSTCSPFCNFQIIEFSSVNLLFWLSEVDEISSLVCPPIQWPQSPLFQLCVWIFKNSSPPPPFLFLLFGLLVSLLTAVCVSYCKCFSSYHPYCRHHIQSAFSSCFSLFADKVTN